MKVGRALIAISGRSVLIFSAAVQPLFEHVLHVNGDNLTFRHPQIENGVCVFWAFSKYDSKERLEGARYIYWSRRYSNDGNDADTVGG